MRRSAAVRVIHLKLFLTGSGDDTVRPPLFSMLTVRSTVRRAERHLQKLGNVGAC